MTNSFLLLVLLSTVVLSDFAGECPCELNDHDEDPLSCSCYVCIKAPPNGRNQVRAYTVNNQILGRGPAYAGQFQPKPTNRVDALYADPARGDCPPMKNYKNYHPFRSSKAHSPPQFGFPPHETYKYGYNYKGQNPHYVWQTDVGKKWYHSIPMVYVYFGPGTGGRYKRGGYMYHSAWDMFADKPRLYTRKPVSKLFEKKKLGKGYENPCKKSSFAICTYCFSIYSMRTLYSLLSVFISICVMDMDHIELISI